MDETSEIVNVSWESNNNSFFNDEPISLATNSTLLEDILAMPWWVQMSWTTVFVVMIFIAVGGNCIVMWIVVAHKPMRTITNYFLVNLSIADLLLSVMNCFFNCIFMIQGNWQFGTGYCKVNNFIANVTVAASVFTLTAISCDRYLAIVHPLQPRLSKTSSIITIVAIWVLSMVLAIPCVMYSTTITYRFNGRERVACLLIWPDGPPTISTYDITYQIVFLVITYIIPMILMVCCYSSMGQVLWGSKSIGEQTQRQCDAIKAKRKVVRMFIFIVFVFGICWLPYHGYFIYTHFDRKILYTKYVQHIYLAFYWFAMANAMVNPLIYYWMNARFKRYYRRALCGWTIVLKRNSADNTQESNQEIPRSGTYDDKRKTVQLKLSQIRRSHYQRSGNSNIFNVTNKLSSLKQTSIKVSEL